MDLDLYLVEEKSLFNISDYEFIFYGNGGMAIGYLVYGFYYWAGGNG